MRSRTSRKFGSRTTILFAALFVLTLAAMTFTIHTTDLPIIKAVGPWYVKILLALISYSGIDSVCRMQPRRRSKPPQGKRRSA